MRKKKIWEIVLVWFQVIQVNSIWPGEEFNLDKYYAERIVIKEDVDGTTFLTASQSKDEAFGKLAQLSPNCSFPSDIEEYGCDQLDENYCKYRKTHSNEQWKGFGYTRNECPCDLGTCDGEDTNSTFIPTVLYPGCSCGNLIQCDFKNHCPHWNSESNHNSLKFQRFDFPAYGSFLQAGSEHEVFHKKRVSLVSSIFRQSGLNCSLRFVHHFTQQSSSSKLAVRVHFLHNDVPKNITLYEFSKPSKIVWRPVVVKIGSYARPFKISIDCETGVASKKKKLKSKDSSNDQKATIACGLAEIAFDSCEDVRDPVSTCSRGDEFLCSTVLNTRCLTDSRCDMRVDCEDGSDEMDCDNGIRGSKCDFNTIGSFCDGWEQYSRISDAQESQFEATTKAPINQIGETPIFLMSTKMPSSRFVIQKEAWKGAGGFLFYQTPTKKSKRTSALVSPSLPRTNPEAYNKDSKLFGTCKLRFYMCAKTHATTWHVSIISRVNYPLDSGRTTLFQTRAYETTYTTDLSCEWERVIVTIPRQNGGFRLAIFVEYQYDMNDDYIGLDDLSFSPSCFEKNRNESTWETPDLQISTCGSTGFDKPSSCDQLRALDGQTGHFLKEDGKQEWTVPTTGFYRIEACGAGGGSTDQSQGDVGECVILQVHLMENLALRMLIGQMGESACFSEQDDELKAASCAKSAHVKHRNGGAGGGGATRITVESTRWNVVVGGGAGASWNNADAFGGYGASDIPVDIDEKCTRVCRAISHTSFEVENNEHQCPITNQTTVFGGFGGGGHSCGTRGGGGAGYKGGNPFGEGRERSGTSYVNTNFSKDVGYYQAENVDDGFIKISFCRKQCTPPSVCRFKNEQFEEEYCGCPDGSDFTNTTDSCACNLDCPFGATCQYHNFTSEPFCMCNNGKFIDDIEVDFCEEPQSWMWYNYLLMTFVLLVIIASFVVVFHYRNRTQKIKQELFNLNLMTSTRYQYDDIYFGLQTRKDAIQHLPLIPRDSVKLGRVLGKGNFGEVHYGEYDGKKLAVKIISKPFSASLSAQADFCNEALCMGTFVDDNVVQLVGVDFEELPYLIALEFMEGGDLLSFVKESRPNKVSLNPFHLTMFDLIKIVTDVASGCKCLEGFKYVHRDIAARNILLTTRGPQRVAKIADFGMAKAISNEGEYYRVHGRAMLPIKWTPPEAFIDGVFTTKSDIWSFGILCWEVFSLGVVPYPNRRNEEVMLMLTEGGRLEYPYGIPTRVYELMRACWRTKPENRPEFAEVAETLSDILTDSLSVGMPFPIHPTVRASYAHAQSTPVSVETPQTAMTDISMSSTCTNASTVRLAGQQDVKDRIKLHELMLTREQPYTSELTACVVDNLRKDLARAQFETGMTSVPQPEYLSPESIDESVQLIPTGNTVTEQTPPTSLVNLSHLAVQNTGPTLHRPDSLNFHDRYSTVPLLECQTN